MGITVWSSSNYTLAIHKSSQKRTITRLLFDLCGKVSNVGAMCNVLYMYEGLN